MPRWTGRWGREPAARPSDPGDKGLATGRLGAPGLCRRAGPRPRGKRPPRQGPFNHAPAPCRRGSAPEREAAYAPVDRERAQPLGGPPVHPQPPRATLAIVAGTFNRLGRLRHLIESVQAQTRTPYRIHVADAGSGDGTRAYLRELAGRDGRVVPHLDGVRPGQAQALNDVFARLDTPLACWLSDDHVVVDGGLDAAVAALRRRPRLGLLGLKVRDLSGPYAGKGGAPYIGGLSTLGVLNVNQGLLPVPLFRRLGGFAEEYVDYGIDPDLTTRVLLAGWDVAYTRQVVLHHYRDWAADPGEVARRHARRQRALEIYERTFARDARLGGWPGRLWWRCKRRAFAAWARLCPPAGGPGRAGPGYHHRDYHNAWNGRYVSVFDLFRHRLQASYLVQKGRKACPGNWSSTGGPSATKATPT